jgi:hypothetical protein
LIGWLSGADRDVRHDSFRPAAADAISGREHMADKGEQCDQALLVEGEWRCDDFMKLRFTVQRMQEQPTRLHFQLVRVQPCQLPVSGM